MYHHEIVGTNSRLDALQAAILRVKLRHLDTWCGARQANAQRYDELLGDIPQVKRPIVTRGNNHVYNQYTIRADDRESLRKDLEAKGVGSAVYYPVPLHLQQCFASLGFEKGSLPVSEKLCEEVLSLPIYPELPRRDVDKVAEAVRAHYA